MLCALLAESECPATCHHVGPAVSLKAAPKVSGPYPISGLRDAASKSDSPGCEPLRDAVAARACEGLGDSLGDREALLGSDGRENGGHEHKPHHGHRGEAGGARNGCADPPDRENHDDCCHGGTDPRAPDECQSERNAGGTESHAGKPEQRRDALLGQKQAHRHGERKHEIPCQKVRVAERREDADPETARLPRHRVESEVLQQACSHRRALPTTLRQRR